VTISRRRLITLLALLAGSIFCISLVLFRHYYTGGGYFPNLTLNLFLAWIPFVLAVVVYDHWRRRGIGPTLVVLAALWLLFFPNAPYLATDVVHLERGSLAPFWYDAVTYAAFAWIGVLLGFASLYLMQSMVRQWLGEVTGWIFAIAAIGLGSLGIYLGRVLRLNSWDALEHPSVIPRMLHAVVRDPFAYQEAIAVMILFSFALTFAYFLLYNFAALSLELERER
jgi:uncharacterized membrane protein